MIEEGRKDCRSGMALNRKRRKRKGSRMGMNRERGTEEAVGCDGIEEREKRQLDET